MKIAITVGHSLLKSGNYTSAQGIKNEYLYCKEEGKYLKEWLEKEGHAVDLIICPEKQFISSKEEYNYKVPKVNNGKYDLLIELHLNCFNKTACGVEVLHYDNGKGLEYAKRVVNKLGTQFKNRGAKQRTDLYILRDTYPTAILIENFFCDNKEDCDKADKLGHKAITKLIAEGILNKTIEEKNNIYKIVTGGFGSKENAEKKMNAIKELTGWWMNTEKFKPNDYRIVTGGMSKKDADKNLDALKQLTKWWAVVEKQ